MQWALDWKGAKAPPSPETLPPPTTASPPGVEGWWMNVWIRHIPCLMFSNNELVCRLSHQTWLTSVPYIVSHTISEAQHQRSWKFIHSTTINWVPGNLLIHELEVGKTLFRSYTRAGSLLNVIGHVFPKHLSSDLEQTVFKCGLV